MATKKRRKKGTLFGKPRDKVVKHPGSFKKEAKEHNESTEEYANKVLRAGSKASTKTKRKASLAKAFATMRKDKKEKHPKKK